MRILVVSQYFWPENFRVNDVVSELVKRGHKITVLTGKPNYPDGKVFAEFLRCPDRFATYEGARIVRVPIWPRGKSKFSLLINYLSYALNATLLGIFHLRGEQFDVIFVSQYSPATVGLPAIALRRLKRVPIVFWVLDQWPETLSAVGVIKSKVVLRLVGRLVTFIYAHCDLVLAQSKSLVSQIGKYYPNPGKIAYFPSWAEKIYDDRPVVLAPEVNKQSGIFSILFAGNIGEAQDFPAILDAAELLKSHKNIRWLILGDGRQADWLKGEVSRRRLQDCVLLLGRFPVERMPSFYGHADALLVSLKAEAIFSMTIPGKIQSYLIAGIPILGMLDGEGADAIQEAEAGLVCPAGDAVGLADAVVKMVNLSPVVRSEMGRKGQLYATNEFDRSVLLDRLEEWLEEFAYPK